MKNIALIKANYGSKNFDFALNLIFDEWGDGNKEHLKAKKQSLKEDKITKCYVLILNSTPVGCFVICENDLKGYPEYNPNLACVCVDKNFRGKGYSKILMQKSNEMFRKLNIKTAYLKTNLINFYEKFGWVYVKNIKIDGEDEKLYVQNFE